MTTRWRQSIKSLVPESWQPVRVYQQQLQRSCSLLFLLLVPFLFSSCCFILSSPTLIPHLDVDAVEQMLRAALVFATNSNNKVRSGRPAKEQNCRAIIWVIYFRWHSPTQTISFSFLCNKCEPGLHDQLRAAHQGCCALLFTTQACIWLLMRRSHTLQLYFFH